MVKVHAAIFYGFSGNNSLNMVRTYCFWGMILLALLPLFVGAQGRGGFGETDIKEKFEMEMSTYEPICIKGSVVLSCSLAEENILKYSWKNKKTGEEVGNKRTITVSPDTTTTYVLEVTYVDKSDERIENWDFEKGNPVKWNDIRDYQQYFGFYSEHNYVRKTGHNVLWDEGLYAIGKNPHDYHQDFGTISDHTSGAGYMMIVNGAPGKDVKIWEQRIQVTPGKQYAFSIWGIALTPANPAVLRFSINGDGSALDKFYLKNTLEWQQFYRIWTVPEGHSSVITISLLNNVVERNGNDFAIDDFSFAPVKVGTGEVTVRVLPQIKMEKLVDNQVCEGADLAIKAELSAGSDIRSYEWKKGTQLLSNKEKLQIHKADVLRDGGMYYCKVTGVCGADSVAFNVVVRDTLKVEPLTDKVVCKGKAVTWNVETRAGYPPIQYKWNLPSGAVRWMGQMKAALSKAAVDDTDSGIFSCEVRNGCGSQEVSASLSFRPALRIEAFSGDTILCEGESLFLGVKANLKNVDITWKCPGGQILTGDTLSIAAVEETDAGVYLCTVTDLQCGTVEQRAVKVALHESLADLILPEKLQVCRGESVELIPRLTGREMTFEWERPDGVILIDTNIYLEQVDKQQAGMYKLKVTDRCGKVVKGQTDVEVLVPAEGLEISESAAVCPGSMQLLEITGGSDQLSYVWSAPGGREMAGRKWEIHKVSEADTGEYICRVTGLCHTDISLSTRLSFIATLKAFGNEGVFEQCPGTAVSWQVSAFGKELSYQWSKDGYLLENRMAQLNRTAITEADTGQYVCEVKAACGESRQFPFRLRLKSLTRIVEQSSDKDVGEHEALRLFVKALGENNVYEWRKDGVVLAGERGSYLIIPDVGVSGEYNYSCQVAGACGEDEARMKVKVGAYNVIKEDKTVRLCKGGDFAFSLSGLPEGCKDDANLTYSWMYKGEIVSHTAVMAFSGVRLEDSGVYIGTVVGNCGRKEVRLKIEVVEVPSIKEIRRDGEFVEDSILLCAGENAEIKPVVVGGPFSTIEWFKDGVYQHNEDVYSVINAEMTENSAFYTCVVAGECGEDRYDFEIVVRPQLRIVDYQPLVNVCSGDVVEFVVTAFGYKETYEWSGPASGWEKPKINKYLKSSVGAEDAGIYRCIVSSFCGDDTLYSELQVEKELSVVDVTSGQTVCRGSRVNMYVVPNAEVEAYYWTLPNGEVRPDRSFEVLVQAADTGWYRYEMQGHCMAIEGRVYLGMYREPGELSIEGDSVVCRQGTVHLEARIEGDEVHYRWMGPRYWMSSGSDLILSEVDETKTGRYEITVTDACGQVKKKGINIVLQQELDTLALNIADTVLCVGTDLRLEVLHRTKGLTYRWHHNGQFLSSSPVLELSDIGENDTGEYRCEVRGSCGTRELVAYVGIYRSLTARAVDAVVRECPATDVILRAEAEGVDVSYQWLRNGGEVGSRTASYMLSDIVAADSGLYQCVVGSRCGHVLLDYYVQVKPKTRILSTSPDKFVCEYEPTRLDIVAEGEGNEYYWWCRDQLLEEKSSFLNIPDVGSTDTIVFTCKVTGDCGQDSARIYIKVGAFKPMRGGSDTLCEHSNYVYNMEVAPVFCYGNERFTYCWFKVGGDTLSREPLLHLQDVSEADEGRYACYIVEECGDTTVYMDIKVLRLPQLATVFQDTSGVEGDCMNVFVRADGDELCYGWMKDGQLLEAEGEGVRLCPLVAEDEGRYRIEVSNRCSHVIAQLDLSVWKKTMFISPQEQKKTVCPRDSVRMEVEAVGEPGLLYKWYKNEELLPVACLNELVFPQVTDMDTGIYVCKVYGRGGVDSSRIDLRLYRLPSVKIEGEFCICENDLQQVYQGESDEERVVWKWEAEEGYMEIQNGKPYISVRWNGQEEARIRLIVTSLNTGCVNRREDKVIYKPLPDLNLNIPAYVGNCIDSVFLDFAYPSGGTYRVNGEEESYLYVRDKDKRYSVQYHYTDIVTRCSAVVEAEVVVAQPPLLTMKMDTLMIGSCREVRLDVVERHSPGSVKWTPDRGLDADGEWIPVYTPDVSRFYHATLTDAYGCQATEKVFVDVVDRPKVVIGADTVIGECNSLTLHCRYFTDYFRLLDWGVGLRDLGEQTAEVVEKSVGKNSYVVSVEDKWGCRGSDTVTVGVEATDGIESKEVCLSETPFTVDCSRFHAFRWEDDYPGTVRELKQAGEYILRTEDRYGCRNETWFYIHPQPEVSLPDTFVFEGQKMEYILTLNGKYGPYDISWQDGSGSSSYVADQEGIYEVMVKDNIGCSAKSSAYLEVRKMHIAAPDAFLPASKGMNSRFYLKEVNFIGNFEMFIYNRSGELIYHTDEIGFNGGWDGAFKGVECLPGAYVWVAFNNGKMIGKGTVMLVK